MPLNAFKIKHRWEINLKKVPSKKRANQKRQGTDGIREKNWEKFHHTFIDPWRWLHCAAAVAFYIHVCIIHIHLCLYVCMYVYVYRSYLCASEKRAPDMCHYTPSFNKLYTSLTFHCYLIAFSIQWNVCIMKRNYYHTSS